MSKFEVSTGDTRLWDNDLLVELAHPVLGISTMYGIPVKLTRTPFTAMKHAPLCGEDTREILQELGCSEGAIEGRHDKNIVRGGD